MCSANRVSELDMQLVQLQHQTAPQTNFPPSVNAGKAGHTSKATTKSTPSNLTVNQDYQKWSYFTYLSEEILPYSQVNIVAQEKSDDK